MSIWASIRDDRLNDIPDRDEFGEVDPEGPSTFIDVAICRGWTEYVRFSVADAEVILAPEEVAALIGALTTAIAPATKENNE
jgi:hypothetical protein